jgi:hypothetical protein
VVFFARFLDVPNNRYEYKVTKHLFSINRGKVVILYVKSIPLCRSHQNKANKIDFIIFGYVYDLICNFFISVRCSMDLR